LKNKKFWASLMALLLAAIMLLSLILSLIPTNVKAASSSQIKEQINQLQQDQKDLEKELKELKAQQKENLNDIKDMVSQKSVIEQQAGLLHEQVELLNEQIAAYALLIADKQLEVEAAEKHLAELNKKHKERIRAMEEDGNVSYWSVLFQANSFSDFLDRLNIIQEIAASDRRRLSEMREAAAEVAAAQEVLQAEKLELEQSRVALDAKQAELEIKEEEADALLQQLLAKGEEYEALQKQQEDELLELELSIGQAKIDYEDAKYKEYLAYMATMPTGGGKISYDKDGIAWVVPCSYKRVSSSFGWRTHPVHGDRRFHTGVDFATGCPNKIYASRSGVVTISQYSSSAGWYVTIDHLDGYQSTYMHMCKRPDVKVGQVVAAGQVLGCIGTTGTSTGNHLHFGIYKNGNPVNPMDYVGN
jgi:murein DD-endopeptidase MepM/ murein hydrolase activator NlpD